MKNKKIGNTVVNLLGLCSIETINFNLGFTDE